MRFQKIERPLCRSPLYTRTPYIGDLVYVGSCVGNPLFMKLPVRFGSVRFPVQPVPVPPVPVRIPVLPVPVPPVPAKKKSIKMSIFDSKSSPNDGQIMPKSNPNDVQMMSK